MTGLFGGTFDPFHLGHLDVLRAARRALSLERIIVIPSKLPPHRDQPRASGEDRLAMAKLAVADEPGCDVSDVELKAEGPSYTIDTLAKYVGRNATYVGPNFSSGKLCFVTGADAFAGITSWHRYPELVDLCHFAVVSRPEMPAPVLRRTVPALADRMIDVSLDGSQLPACETEGRTCIFLIDAPTAPVSSTSVRARIARNEPLTGHVPESVAAYIAAHGLYQ
jgi:nicotinate-nucleotide adenylyltransferase